MNKILKSLVVGGLGLMMLPGMVKASEILNTYGTSSEDAVLNQIVEDTGVSVTIEWGALKYDYSKQTDSTYKWVPVDSSNYVEIINDSNMVSLSADLNWTPNISNVDVTYDVEQHDGSTLECILENDAVVPLGWGPYSHHYNTDELWSESYYRVFTPSGFNYEHIGEWRNSDHPDWYKSNKFYVDAECSEEVAMNTEYEASKYYRKYPTVKYGNDSSLVLSSKNDGYISRAKWNINLTGGNISDVTEAKNNDSGRIGTISVTLNSVNEN